jgi:hypothetical protein
MVDPPRRAEHAAGLCFEGCGGVPARRFWRRHALEHLRLDTVKLTHYPRFFGVARHGTFDGLQAAVSIRRLTGCNVAGQTRRCYGLITVDLKLVILRRYPARIHAELAKSALEAYDIPAAIDAGGMNSYHETPVFPINLMVRLEDVERALEILGPEETFTD